jgi:hypothetical protein
MWSWQPLQNELNFDGDRNISIARPISNLIN